MELAEFFVGEARSEVGVMFPHELERMRHQPGVESTVARAAAAAIGQSGRALAFEATLQSADLPFAQAQHPGRLRLRECAQSKSGQRFEAIDFGSAHRQELHSPSNRPTGHFYLGENRTSLLGANIGAIRLFDSIAPICYDSSVAVADPRSLQARES
jgi:hypothetical protein